MGTRIGVMQLVGFLPKAKRIAAAFGLAGIFVSGGAHALTPCVTFIPAPPDGRESVPTAVSVAVNPTFFFFGRVGRSYSVDATASANIGIELLVRHDNNLCGTTNSTGVNTGQEDVTGPKQLRASWIQGSTNEVESTVGGASSVNVVVRVTETTLYQPLWGNNGGFNTFWLIQNSTSTLSCTVLLILKNMNGTFVTNGTVIKTIAAGNAFQTATSLMGVAPNQLGQAQLAHDCPPGSIVVDTFLQNDTSSVLPARMLPARQLH